MPFKAGVAGSIPGFSQSVWCDLKPWPVFWDALNQNHCRLSLRVLLDIKPQKKHKPTRPVLVIAKEHSRKQENYVSGSRCHLNQGTSGLIPGFSQYVGWDLKPSHPTYRQAVAPFSETHLNQNHCRLSLCQPSSDFGPLSARRSSETPFGRRFASGPIVDRLIVLTRRVLLDIKNINPSGQYWL